MFDIFFSDSVDVLGFDMEKFSIHMGEQKSAGAIIQVRF